MKEYVQDKIEQCSERVIELIVNKHAHVYVCGRSKMASDVFERLEAIFDRKSTDISKFDQIFKNLKLQNRYHEDIFNS